MHPKQLGKMLISNDVTNIKNITSSGRNRINIDFRTYDKAINFLIHPILDNNNLTAYIYTQKQT